METAHFVWMTLRVERASNEVLRRVEALSPGESPHKIFGYAVPVLAGISICKKLLHLGLDVFPPNLQGMLLVLAKRLQHLDSVTAFDPDFIAAGREPFDNGKLDSLCPLTMADTHILIQLHAFVP